MTYRAARRNAWATSPRPRGPFAGFNGAVERLTGSKHFGPVNFVKAWKASVAKWHARKAVESALKEEQKAARIAAERKAQSMLHRAASAA